jgi:2-dehydro-3-deoxy-D-arabinonate dehydratase
MTAGVFRLRLPNGRVQLAAGDSETGPETLLAPSASIDTLLAAGAGALEAAVAASSGGRVPPDSHVLAPVETQEVWAAGVTYARSKEARVAESSEPSVYDRVYEADRPELFLKAPGWRVRGPGESVGIRADSTWDVPEPELVLVVGADLSIVGYAIGNDMSSRSIEGDNPLYLPQAKIYEGACAIGPCIVPASLVQPPFEIGVEVIRDGSVAVRDATTTARLKRTPEELVAYLGRALSFPVGAMLLTGTGVVPPPEFSLRYGDVVRIEISGLGRLENPVVKVGRSA